MSKRNFILLIIILIIIIITVFGFLYFNQPKPTAIPDSGGTNFFSQFNPFGNNKPATTPNTTNPVNVSGNQPTSTEETPAVKLQRVSSMPVAGFTVFNKERLAEGEVVPPAKGDLGGLKKAKPTPPPTEFMPAIRYVERTSGNIYQTFADKIEEKRFSETIIPKIYEAFFGNKGESVIMRYLKKDGKTIETFVGNLPKELLGGDMAGNNEIKGVFLPEDTKDISMSLDTSSIFYLFDVGNNMVGTTLNLTTNKKVQIFTSPFTEWLSFWPNSKIITLTTKPASGIPGYMYTMDGSGKNLTKAIGEVNGLTTLAGPDGKSILYGDDNLSLNIYHINTKVSTLLGIKTLPEKCVWSKTSDAIYCSVPKSIEANQYPDAWYQGEVSFRDQIWKIDPINGNTTMIIDPATLNGGGEIDGTKLALDDGENYLFFVNKKDSFLWELKLK